MPLIMKKNTQYFQRYESNLKSIIDEIKNNNINEKDGGISGASR